MQESSNKYKQRVDLKRRDKQFQVGDLVMVHLMKEIFPTKTYNKLKMKRIGPCKIVRNFLAKGLEYHQFFNVANLYPCMVKGICT